MIDLATVLAHTTWTTPAPTAGEQPKPTADNPMPSRPGPRITARTKRCCGAVLVGERCDCRNVRRQMNRRPAIVFDFRKAGA